MLEKRPPNVVLHQGGSGASHKLQLQAAERFLRDKVNTQPPAHLNTGLEDECNAVQASLRPAEVASAAPAQASSQHKRVSRESTLWLEPATLSASGAPECAMLTRTQREEAEPHSFKGGPTRRTQSALSIPLMRWMLPCVVRQPATGGGCIPTRKDHKCG